MKSNGLFLKFFSKLVKKDKDIVLAAVQNDGYSLQYESKIL